jgi:hypothetical protein
MRSATPMSVDTIKKLAPAVFQSNPHPERSAKYVHISTEPVLTKMLEAGYGVSRAQQTSKRKDREAGFARHLLTFRPLKTFDKTLKVGDAVPEVLLLNSHDGNCSYRLSLGMYRLVCANGMIVGDSFASVRVRHIGEPAQEVLEATEELFGNQVPKLERWVGGAQKKTLTKRQMSDFAQRAASIRFGDSPPYDPDLLLTTRRKDDDGNTLWRVYNRIQENMMRGGVQYTTPSGKQLVSRPIDRVTKDVMYNQRLWDTANDYLEAA